ncbi:predicted protein [Nematostella vectensis]|uniref:Uncharacterized protein n=1 Tax=Nematostella vectensis TaxID=45351 RepID=A7S468_NEMVE|nr:predicted protein [Nematostella vectensis]|eukprot:XP_001633526.1 predicted protein [Nematostella vectensis]
MAAMNVSKLELRKFQNMMEKQMKKERSFLVFKRNQFLHRQEQKLGKIFKDSQKEKTRQKKTQTLPEIRHAKVSRQNLKQNNNTNTVREVCDLKSKGPIDIGLPPVDVLSKARQPRAHKKTKQRKGEFEPKAAWELETAAVTGTKGQNRQGGFGSEVRRRSVSMEDLRIPRNSKLLHHSRYTKESKEAPGDPKRITQSQSSLAIHSSLPDIRSENSELEASRPEGAASWAVVYRLIGLKQKFRRKKLYGEYQATELDVLDPSLRWTTSTGIRDAEKWGSMKDCRYLRVVTDSASPKS